MLTFSLSRARKVRLTSPVLPRTFWPTTATIAIVGIDGNMFGFLMRQVMGKLVAQRFHHGFRVRRTDHQAEVILRGGLRDQEYVGANRCGSPYGAPQNILDSNHARTADA